MAEALVWNWGYEGVDDAWRAYKKATDDRLFRLMIATLAMWRLDELYRTPSTERGDLLVRWLRRPGQMIIETPPA